MPEDARVPRVDDLTGLENLEEISGALGMDVFSRSFLLLLLLLLYR
jgi:hypothetical protein